MTSGVNSKAEIIGRVDEEWQRLVGIAEGFSDEEQLLPYAVGHWSVKDLLGHIATWDDELVRAVERFQHEGEKTSYGDEAAIDRFNEAEAEKRRGLSLGQVWDEMRRSHRRLLQFLQGLPEEAYAPGTYTGDCIATDSLGHYREHWEDLERWKASH